MSVPISCPCPPKADGTPRHPDGDTVILRASLGFREATAVRNSIQLLQAETPDASVAEILATLTEGYVIYGIESWTLLDDKNKPLPVTQANIRSHILTDWMRGTEVGDAADAIYAEQVMLPLLARASTSSQPSPTTESTSPATPSSVKRPTPLKRSSTGNSQTDATEATSASLAGVSSSSQNSVSAA